ncbi:class II fructose-1,6-bisphosphate aldolase [Patescibacteria group bacterium]|nr:class II fructose-1,6-bisphosphate aldolase [Patescibacteria group bacterium]MBU1906558.1 class II fructose-1,6-bisphosphate aldolase [Patescibacteria group bacterium]
MLVSGKKILAQAERGGYAVGAFNINNMEMLQGVISAAEELHSPVIIQTSEGAIEYAGMKYLVALVYTASHAKIPVVLHLDHGKDMRLIKEAINSGFYTSVMYDGSSKPLTTNIKNTKEVVKLAHRKKITVEAELGAIAGVEDFVSVSEREASLTNAEQAADFVKQTNCDSLAVAIGTAHGAKKFKSRPRLDFKRCTRIDERVRVPLVLHGASSVYPAEVKRANKFGAKIKDARGVNDALIRKAIKCGVRKINNDTDLRIAFTIGIRETLMKQPAVFDPRKYLGPARDRICEITKRKIKLFGSAGKA